MGNTLPKKAKCVGEDKKQSHDFILNIIQCINYDHTPLDNKSKALLLYPHQTMTLVWLINKHYYFEKAPVFSIEDFTGNFNW